MKRALKKLAMMVGGLISGAVLMELCLRLFFPPPMSIMYADEHQIAARLDPTIYLSDSQGVRLKAHRRTIIINHPTNHRTIDFRTNSLGLRGEEPRGGSIPRVLFLGDSITMGSFLQEEETFVQKTEELLNKNEIACQAFNGGIAGTGLRNHHTLLKNLIPSLLPDLIVLQLYLNDFQREMNVRLFLPPESLRGSWLAAYLFDASSVLWEISGFNNQEAPVDFSLWRMQAAANLSPADSSFARHVDESISDWGGAWSDAAWDIIQKDLLEFSATCAAADIPLLIIMFPVSYQVFDEKASNFPQRKAASLAASLNRPFIDALPFLKNSGLSQDDLFYDHCHLTPQGMEQIAELLAPAVSRSLKAQFTPLPSID